MGHAADDLKFVGGVVVAIFAGVVLNLGSLIQKKAVNQMVYIKKKNLVLNDESALIDKDKYLFRPFFPPLIFCVFFHNTKADSCSNLGKGLGLE